MGDLKNCCDLTELYVNMMEEILSWLPLESLCNFVVSLGMKCLSLVKKIYNS
jgi:hypothetical protein